MVKKYIPLISIILLAVFLRFWQLDSNPPGVHTDEADTGYSAYSLLKTGLDPHGEFNLLALTDSNIGGTHPPIYTYLLMPIINIFGLNIFVERSPSGIFGVLTVLLVFFIVRKLFNSASLSNLAAFLFAVNSWAIHISRQGLLEAQSLFFVTLGICLFLYCQKNKYLIIFSAVCFGLSLYSYDAPKIFLPPFLLLIFYFYKDVLFKIKKYLLAFLLVFMMFFVPILHLTFVQGDIADYNRSSIFSSIPENVDSERYLTKAPLWASSMVHNKLTVALKRFQTSYVSIFSINWFFVNGSNNTQHAVANHGQFFLFELPFFFIGIYLVFKKSIRLGALLLGWMLIGAVPGGLTSGNYAYRSIHVLPVPIIFSSVGIIWFWSLISKYSLVKRTIVKAAMLIIALVYIYSYLFTYFFDYPVYASEYWNKQQNDAVRFISEKRNKYEKIFVDGGEPWAIDYAFYFKIDPVKYQKAYNNQEKHNDVKVIKIENIYFGIFNLGNIKKPSDFFPKKSLVVTNAVNFPKAKPIKSFYDSGRIRAIFKVFEVE